MTLDLNDPTSIVAWHAVHPVRHATFLRAVRRLHPQFKPAIDDAIREIRRAATEPPRITVEQPMQ